jgi:hypothetical protein
MNTLSVRITILFSKGVAKDTCKLHGTIRDSKEIELAKKRPVKQMKTRASAAMRQVGSKQNKAADSRLGVTEAVQLVQANTGMFL